MSILAALIQKRQFKQRPHVRALAGQRDEQRHVLRIILDALAVRVKINSPGETAHHECVGSDVSPNPHPFRERVAVDFELVGAIHGLRSGGGGGGDRRGRRRRGFGRFSASPNRAHQQGYNRQALQINSTKFKLNWNVE